MSRNRDWLIVKPQRFADTLRLAMLLGFEYIEAWSPAETVEVRQGKSRSRRRHKVALAPGFVFIRGEHTHKMLEIHDAPVSPYPAFRFMMTAGELSYCPDSALKPLRLAEMKGRAPEEIRQWAPGELVRYSGSGFEGLTGTVERRKGKSVWVRFGPLVVEAPAVLLTAAEAERMAA